MNKDLFIATLRTCLEGEIPGVQIAENVRYYEDYINMQIRSGKTEEEVMNELGDPRFIAKSILVSRGVTSSNSFTEDVYEEDGESGDGVEEILEKTKDVFQKIRPYLILVGIVLIMLLLICFVLNILGFFAPVIIPLLIIWGAITLFKSRK